MRDAIPLVEDELLKHVKPVQGACITQRHFDEICEGVMMQRELVDSFTLHHSQTDQATLYFDPGQDFFMGSWLSAYRAGKWYEGTVMNGCIHGRNIGDFVLSGKRCGGIKSRSPFRDLSANENFISTA